MAANATVPPPHSKRVEAWIHSVLNPVMESLRREQWLLQSGNLSWRAYSRSFEYLQPIREYVDGSQLPNLEDFLDDPENAGFAERFREHDETLAKLEGANKLFVERLTNWTPFSEAIREAYQGYVAEPHGRDLAASTMNPDTLASFVAEYLVNNVVDLQEHYLLYGFWSQNRDRFRSLLKAGTLPNEHESLVHSTSQFSRVSSSLFDELKKHRRHLCVTFDIPAAPLNTSVA